MSWKSIKQPLVSRNRVELSVCEPTWIKRVESECMRSHVDKTSV